MTFPALRTQEVQLQGGAGSSSAGAHIAAAVFEGLMKTRAAALIRFQ